MKAVYKAMGEYYNKSQHRAIDGYDFEFYNEPGNPARGEITITPSLQTEKELDDGKVDVAKLAAQANKSKAEAVNLRPPSSPSSPSSPAVKGSLELSFVFTKVILQD